MKVYIVKFMWATEEDGDTVLFVYDNYQKAYKQFELLVSEEKDPANSWIGDLTWENGKPVSDYIEFYNIDNPTYKAGQLCMWSVTNTWTKAFTTISIEEHNIGRETSPFSTRIS